MYSSLTSKKPPRGLAFMQIERMSEITSAYTSKKSREKLMLVVS